MAKHGKKYRAAAQKVDPDKKYELKEAIGLAKDSNSEKFDESLDVAVRLSVDPRKADQNIRGSVVLPKGTGAVEVGGDDLVAKVQGGWMEFDRVVATPDMMGQVGKLGKVLGPRGLMPNPKTGTVTLDVKQAIEQIQAGKVDYRVDKSGIVHASLGKASFSVEDLAENYETLIATLVKAKPASSKGHYVRGISVSTTMGVGVRVAYTA